jgi:hypothetical protein
MMTVERINILHGVADAFQSEERPYSAGALRECLKEIEELQRKLADSEALLKLMITSPGMCRTDNGPKPFSADPAGGRR